MNEINVAKETLNIGEVLFKEKEYWLDKLSGELSKGYFPYDYQVKNLDIQTTSSVNFTISGETFSRLMQLRNDSDPRLHMIMVAVIDILIYRYSGVSDIIVGTTIDKQEWESEYINTILPLRNQIEDHMTFKQFLLQVKNTIASAVENQNYPVEELYEQLVANTGNNISILFEVAVLLENIQDKKYLRHIQPVIIFSFNRTGEYINLVVEYQASLYKKDTIEKILEHFNRLLEIVIFNVDIKLFSIDLLSPGEKQNLVVEFNNRVNDYPGKKTIHELFEEQAAKTPTSVALILEGREVSYRELNEKSDRLSQWLKQKGIKLENIVGIMIERSIEMIIGILGILKSGGAYLPIDSDYPEERISYMLNDSGAKILFTIENKEGETGSRWECEIYYIKDILRSSYPLTFFPSNLLGSSNLAYVIYTSGSTGKPKGVAVEHRALVNYTWWAAKMYVKNEKVNFPLYTAVGFDLTITSLFTPLITGNTIHIYQGESKEFLLDKIFDENKVEVIKLTPAHLMVIGDNIREKNISKIKRFIVGGDNLETQWAQKIYGNFEGNVEIYNEYGPTETTVGCMIYKYNPRKDKGASVPIGEPADNVQIYLLDKNMNYLPLGGIGELHIGGDGLARGYLNDPELTIAKFIKSPFKGKVSLLYKTGDMARFLPGRQIEFLGRIDHQVKIRGFRIELGEIESQIAKFDGIKEVQVLANENKNGNKYLCAYIVTDDRDIFRQTAAMTKALREYLLYTLAEYMIPSYFIRLANMPLTLHGKIDRKALPLPNMELEKEYVAPANEVENELVKVCSKIFGREKIGITDNYFELGGDSIKAIQIAAGMNKVGYKVEIQQIFQYPIISELASVIKKTDKVAEQGVITETIPLTPIQKWFFSIGLVGIHHFNQAVMLHFEKGIEEEAIKRIFTKLQAHHDALRMSFNIKDNGEIVQINHGLNYPLHLKVYDFRYQEDDQKTLGQKIDELQDSINLSAGPLMKLGLFRLKDGDRLLIIIHHLVIDGVSWRILFEDIDTLCQQYQKGEALTLPLKTDSFSLWAQKLYHYANSLSLLKEKTYWTKLQTNVIPLIKKDFEVEDNYVEDADTLHSSLNKVDTNLLLTEVNNALGTEINDILLTALGLALKRTFGHEKALISMEGHGREKLFADVDITRTIGWFASIYPVLLDLTYEERLSRQIKEVKETLRRIPNKGIGYQILEYLTVNEHIKDINFRLKPQIGFNYLGQFDIDVEKKSFGLAREFHGRTQKSEQKRIIDLEILGMITDRQLNISITFSKKQFRRETIEKLLSAFKKGLIDIISYCSSCPERELTPSDLTYKGLSIENLEQLSKRYPINDIYALTPMQEGMLFHALANTSSYAYFEQISYQLREELEVSLLEKSANELLKRHDILRTAFVYKDIERPVQVVLKNRNIDFYHEDISRLANEEKKIFCAEFKEKDKRCSFDLNNGNLVRLSILRLEESVYEFIWSFHHILMDGWCITTLNVEFLEIYTSYLENRPYFLPGVSPYRTYIQWLEKQDKEESARYWQNCLDSYEEQARIPISGVKISKENSERNSYLNKSVSIEFDREKTAFLNKLAAGNNVTLNTAMQALWGILLGKYNNKEDVVFGTVVSGRPSELAGVESMVGLFINTIPVRIRFEGRTKLNALLRKSQEEALSSEPYHYYPLAEIQSGSILKQNLIDHIFIFENYPIAGQIEGYRRGKNKNNKTSLKIENIEVFEQTNYDFNVILSGAELLRITFQYNGNVYKKDFVERIAKHFSIVVDQTIENQELEVRELTLLSEDEKNRLLYEFNDTAVEYPKDKTIHQLFEEQTSTSKTPDNIALLGDSNGEEKKRRKEEKKKSGVETLRATSTNLQITYRQLNEQSNRLAGLLIEKGVQPDIIMGIMMERSVEMIIGILGILKSGGAYLPIDPDYPHERIDYMLKDSGAKLLITNDDKESEKVGRWEGEKVLLEKISQFQKNASYPLKFLPSYIESSSNLAYVIYTSGTTGQPKGALIEHRNVVRLLFNDKFQFDFTNRDGWTLFHSFCFDFSVWEMYGALLYGGRLVIVPKMVAIDTSCFLELLIREVVTVLNQTPSVFYNLINECLNAHPRNNFYLKYVIFGGEALNPLKLKDWHEKFPKTKIINMFGITETTVHVTYKEINNKDIELNISNIGKPIPTLSTYILNKYLNPIPVGIRGEICVGGDGVARGYLNQVELTGEKFINNPYRLGNRLYRSGDVGRFLENGDMEYLGRFDHQVKIRGFRIELGEIENQLLKYEGIKNAVVLAGETPGEKYLCAYIISHKEFTLLDLRSYLLRKLPDYMIPSYFIRIEKIPLMENGKVDRRALPKPELKAGQLYIGPRDEIEKKLIDLWAEILSRDALHASQLQTSIGIEDDFFELGGHSLKATILVSRIHKIFDVKLPLSEIFQTPRIKELAIYIKEKSKDIYISIKPTETKEYYKLSSSQRRLYSLQQMNPNSIAYNMPILFQLEGILDRDRLEETFRKLVERHESLRTSFQLIGEEVVQKIYGKVEFKIEKYNFEPKDTTDTLEQTIQGLVRTFDLSKTPLLCVGLLKIEDEKYILMVDMHHIISDGISQSILIEDFMTIYEGRELPPLKLQYKDFSEWQWKNLHAGHFIKQEEYWLSRFKGSIPVLDISTDYPRPALQRFEGCTINSEIEKILTRKLKALAAAQGVTLYMLLLAIYTILLSKYTNKNDIIVGSPVAGRRHADLEPIVGMFINVLLMRNLIAPPKKFEEFLEEVKYNTLQAFENQDYSIDYLAGQLNIKRDASRNPLYEVIFAMETQSKHGFSIPGLELKPFQYSNETIKTDLRLGVAEVGEELITRLTYSTALFKRKTADDMLQHYVEIIEQVTADKMIKIEDIRISHHLKTLNSNAFKGDHNEFNF